MTQKEDMKEIKFLLRDIRRLLAIRVNSGGPRTVFGWNDKDKKFYTTILKDRC